jgi:hypothetical protein
MMLANDIVLSDNKFVNVDFQFIAREDAPQHRTRPCVFARGASPVFGRTGAAPLSSASFWAAASRNTSRRHRRCRTLAGHSPKPQKRKPHKTLYSARLLELSGCWTRTNDPLINRHCNPCGAGEKWAFLRRLCRSSLPSCSAVATRWLHDGRVYERRR